MEQRLLKDAEKIILAARMVDDGTWRSVLVVTYQDRARKPFVGEHPQSFETSEDAKEWASKHIAPLLSVIGDKVEEDVKRPKGLHCTQYEWAGKEKVYCGRPAQFHLALAPIAVDEYCCEEHSAEILRLLPKDLEGQLRRIN